MDNFLGLENVAYTGEYQSLRRRIIESALSPDNIFQEKEYTKNGFRRVVTEYCAKDGESRYYCSENRVFDENGNTVHTYISLYHHPFFCTPVEHSNGKRYLVYRQGLYGYSVYDLTAKAAFDYIPARSYQGGETFIATDIFYNRENNIVAVDGCYWAGPTETFLFHIPEPMELFPKYLNLHCLLDEEYDLYDEMLFEGWEGTSVRLRCTPADLDVKSTDDVFVITQEEYIKGMQSPEHKQ